MCLQGKLESVSVEFKRVHSSRMTTPLGNGIDCTFSFPIMLRTIPTIRGSRSEAAPGSM